MNKIISYLKRVFLPNVSLYSEDHPQVEKFVHRLAEYYYSMFSNIDDDAPLHTTLGLPVFGQPFEGDKMWEWVCSQERKEWLINQIQSRLGGEGLWIKINDDWSAKRIVK